MCKEDKYAEVAQEITLLPPCSNWLTPQFQMQYAPQDSSSSSSDESDSDKETSNAKPSSSSRTSNSTAGGSNSMETDEDGWTTVPSRRRH